LQKEDGLPAPHAFNVGIFVDEVAQFNGPLFLFPRSHQEGMLPPLRSDGDDRVKALETYKSGPSWISNVTASLKYSLGREVVAQLVNRHGTFAACGPVGTVLFFHPNLVHASAANIPPFDRTLGS
jgi:ectoine hydroxylase